MGIRSKKKNLSINKRIERISHHYLFFIHFLHNLFLRGINLNKIFIYLTLYSEKTSFKKFVVFRNCLSDIPEVGMDGEIDDLFEVGVICLKDWKVTRHEKGRRSGNKSEKCGTSRERTPKLTN